VNCIVRFVIGKVDFNARVSTLFFVKKNAPLTWVVLLLTQTKLYLFLPKDLTDCECACLQGFDNDI